MKWVGDLQSTCVLEKNKLSTNHPSIPFPILAWIDWIWIYLNPIFLRPQPCPANPDPSARRTRKCTQWVGPIGGGTPHPQCPGSWIGQHQEMSGYFGSRTRLIPSSHIWLGLKPNQPSTPWLWALRSRSPHPGRSHPCGPSACHLAQPSPGKITARQAVGPGHGHGQPQTLILKIIWCGGWDCYDAPTWEKVKTVKTSAVKTVNISDGGGNLNVDKDSPA